MNKIEKMAQKDAQIWAAAEMFYGEGAGTRRKLTWAEISDKQFSVPGYVEAFNKAYESLNMDKFAKGAIKERKNIDRAVKAGKNLRALKAGNVRGLSTGLYVAVGVAYVAHATGYDKVAYRKAKKAYRKAELEIQYRYVQFTGRSARPF